MNASRRNRAELERIFPGDSEMARRMRSFDWSTNPLGPPETWPQNLKTSVRITLTSRHPMFVWWGKQLINLYNDGYVEVLCSKHPAALGQPAPIVWSELWEQVGPRAEFAMRRDEGTYDEALPLITYRKGYPEEMFITFSYSPIPDDRGGFGGILCPATEETKRIIGERQLALLRELAARPAEARTWQNACTLSANALATNPDDLPFGLIYVIGSEKQSAFLAGAYGISPGSSAAPEKVLFDAPSLWPLDEASRTRRACLVTDLTAVSRELPTVRGYPLRQAIALPIAPSGETGMAGVLVLGLNPLRAFEESYQNFLEMVAGGISTAITNGHAYEKERKRVEALAELDRAKTAFFSNVSHEFRTPLTLLLGPLEDEIKENPKSDRLQIAHRNSLRLLKLVNTLLDFSRIEAGRIEAVYEPTDINSFTTELAGVFRSAIERAGLRLNVECSPISEQVYVDREMWEKIVLNLLSNAFKFTFEGEITVTLVQNGNHLELSVSDTGVGISESELPHIFERFHRIKGMRSRTHEGTGIGLALVQELVRLHDGNIKVRSTEEIGSTFTVSIPLGASHLPQDRVGATRKLGSTGSGATYFVEEALRWLPEPPWEFQGIGDVTDENHPQSDSGMGNLMHSARILIADDNADMRDYLNRLLAKQHEVIAVADGEAALEAVQEFKPELVLTDIMMPRLDGYGLLKKLRSDPQTQALPVILLSARAGEESRIEGLGSGADDYLIKPFSARELLARVNTHLKLARVRKFAEDTLRSNNEELEQRVRERTLELEHANEALSEAAENLSETNAALRVLLKQRERDKSDFQESILTNLEHLVEPYIEKLKKSPLSSTQKNWLDILESHMATLTHSFSRNLLLHHSHLTPTEMRVAALVRDGKSSKEIAEAIGASEKTVTVHRNNIRRKLGLRGGRGNLRSHLLSFT